MVKRKVANPLAFAVLGSLSERPMHPYEISSMLKSRGKDQSIKLNYGSLYSVVSALEKQEFIKAVETIRDGNRPERTVYAITEAGLEEFNDWLSRAARNSREGLQPAGSRARLPARLPAGPGDRAARAARSGARCRDRAGGRHPRIDGSGELPSHLLGRVGVPARTAPAQRSRSSGGWSTEIQSGELEGSDFWRKGFEIVEQLGIQPGELFKDPVKYFGEEFSWMQQFPPDPTK